MLNIKDVKLSKTKSRIAIENGKYSGWDDPRTWSMQSLSKRGILPKAVRNFIIGLGMSLADIVMPTEILYAENRKFIDAKANRYFAVLDPINLPIRNAPKVKSAKALLHPDFPRHGSRRIPVNSSKIYVEREDFERFYGKNVGLMSLYTINMKREKGKADFVSKKIRLEDRKVHWVSEPNVKVKIVMPDGGVHKAIAEPGIKKVKAGDVIQFVRVGFCRVEKTKKETVLYFAHK